MTTPGVHVEVADGRGLITLDRPEALNAWDTNMQRAVMEAVRDFSEDPGVKFIIVTGAGDQAFCAGQHLAETAEFGSDDVADWLQQFSDLYNTFLSSPKPIIAAINGVAAGSGYQLTLICDIRIGHSGVRIGQPEVKSGIPSVTGQYLTALSLGHSRTTELMLSGRLMDAEEAIAVGLIHRVVEADEVMDTAVAVGRELAAQPPNSFRMTKKRIRDRIWPGLEESFQAAQKVDEEAWASGEPQRVAAEFFEERARRRAAREKA
ncbi:MAG: enoyl-CoA hydratase/isomerase family protein [Propionibacteriaceae bacterium]